ETVEANTLLCESFSYDPLRNSRLTRVETKILIFRQHEFNLPMLLDSGATASFININKLPSTMAETVKQVIAGNKLGKSFGLERIKFRIKSALSCESIACARGKVKLKARSEILLEVKVDTKNKQVLFEPASNYSGDLDKGIIWSRNVGTVSEKGKLVVSMMNVLNSEATVEPGTTDGEWEETEIVEDAEPEEKLLNQEGDINWESIKINPKLSIKKQNKVRKLISKYKAAFQWSEYDVGTTNVTQHKIDTVDAKPLKQKQYRMPQMAQVEIEKQVKSMLDNNIIEESRRPWSIPIILVKKKMQEVGKQEYRFCIDFRKLNQVTVKDSYPLPRIDDTVDALGGAKFFTTLDLAAGSWQKPLADEDKEKAAFTANNRTLDDLLREFETHLVRLEEVLKRFVAANLKLKPGKCTMLMETVNYLGYHISSTGPDY
ncbi:unnamed protein product, partial [Brachionus calyciflorus]